MAELETYIPLEDAAQKYDLRAHVLTDLVEKGELRAVQVGRRIAVAEGEVFDLVKEMTGDGKKYAPLEGKPIRVSKAAEKYQMPHATLSKWAKRGYICVIERRGCPKSPVQPVRRTGEDRTPEPVLSEAEGICAGGGRATTLPTATAASPAIMGTGRVR
jgi:hypothetical protein